MKNMLSALRHSVSKLFHCEFQNGCETFGQGREVIPVLPIIIYERSSKVPPHHEEFHFLPAESTPSACVNKSDTAAGNNIFEMIRTFPGHSHSPTAIRAQPVFNSVLVCPIW
eukprot:1080294-Amorphochlora_amoeboformis.AAC.1